MTAFFLWMGDNREKIKAENPDFGVTEIGKKGGELWRELDEATKSVRVDLGRSTMVNHRFIKNLVSPSLK